MSFKSIDRILANVLQQSSLQQQPFQLALQYWSQVVGSAITPHTQLLSIQKNVLWVATSSAAWAQTLTMERSRILTKLNVYLPSPLTDIRFSTAQWQRPETIAKNRATADNFFGGVHPSVLAKATSTEPKAPKCKDAQAAFSQWVKTTQQKNCNLPLCPQCQAPTPPGELQRWQVCCICAVKEF
ncbi:DciA family protein [Synechocystis sp. PCC 7509]|uniref:DciA family protein n=1 Tax=Synechocystis sp. PCC 7509 TaxID=927677 RepID=UPI0002AC621A|nr:DciA family protein [Synechocystis sp. PCC 7509]